MIIKEGPNGEILLPTGMYEVLLDKRVNHSNMAREIQLLKNSIIRIFKDSESIYDPSVFRRFCSDGGAPNIFTWISGLMAATRRKEKRQATIEQLTTNIIYTLCFGLSQKCNYLQKNFSSFLMSENLSRPALSTARRLGIACSDRSHRTHESRLLADYKNEIDGVIQDAIINGHLIIAIIDDFTTIHSHKRSDSEQTSEAKSMCAIVIRVFRGIPAVPIREGNTHLNPDILLPVILATELTSDKYFYPLFSTFASSMSNAITTKFFQPESVRHRLEIHQYKESDNVRQMGPLDNLYLVDFQECKLKSFGDYRKALELLISTKVRDYALKFALPLLGDWPTQFYVRRIVYKKLSQLSSLDNHVNHSSLPLHHSSLSLHNHMYSINVRHPPPANIEISSNEKWTQFHLLFPCLELCIFLSMHRKISPTISIHSWNSCMSQFSLIANLQRSLSHGEELCSLK